MRPITAAILAGGRSERMGRDKAQIVWHGETLLARTARVAREADCDVLVVGRDRPDGWPLPDVTFMPDSFVGQGPLGGLATALAAAEGAPVLALACDMPRLETGTVRWLLGEADWLLKERGADGLVVCNGHQWEPLFSVYTSFCLSLAVKHLREGRRSLHALIGAGNFQFFQPPPEIAAALVNVNTPEDLGQL